MAGNTAGGHWNNGGHILAAVSGVLFGIAPVLLKIASADFFTSYYTITGGLIALVAFFLMQKAMHSGKISAVVSVVTAASIITTFALSMTLLSEQISYVKWFGAIAVIFGAMELARGSGAEKDE